MQLIKLLAPIGPISFQSYIIIYICIYIVVVGIVLMVFLEINYFKYLGHYKVTFYPLLMGPNKFLYSYIMA
jgi:hypothetical protein